MTLFELADRVQVWVECAADPACEEMTGKTSMEAAQVAMGLASGALWAIEEDAAMVARCEITDILNESKRTSPPGG